MVGLLSLLFDKRAGNADIPNYSEELILDFDLEISILKKKPARAGSSAFYIYAVIPFGI